MATYPASLPNWKLPLSWQATSGVIRTQMDAGPDKVRARSTATSRNFQTEMEITGAQRTTLETFFHTTLSEGALSFDRADPRDDTTQTYRFLSPPQFTQRVGDETPDDRIYRVTLSLERLP